MKHIVISTENYIKVSNGISFGFYGFALLELMRQKGPQSINDLVKFWKALRGMSGNMVEPDINIVLSLIQGMTIQNYVQQRGERFKTTSHYDSLIHDISDSEFERFWNIFKGESGQVARGTKRKAKIAWQSVLKRFPNITPEELIECAQKYSDTIEDRKYMKYAEGFLSSDMWQNFLNLESTMSFTSTE